MFKKVNLKKKVGKRQYYRRVSECVNKDMKNIFCRTENKGTGTEYSISDNIIVEESDDNLEIDSDHYDELPGENDDNYYFQNNVASGNSHNLKVSDCIETSLNNSKLYVELKNWATTENIAHSSVTKLLHILKPYHTNLPLDCRTLLKTPRTINVKQLCNGEYVHFNLEGTLFNILSKSKTIASPLELSINIDGLPLFHSSPKQFWPILGLIKNVCSPFVIGIFCGTSKPEPLHLFLQEFMTDITHLMQNGITFHNTVYEVKIYNFICDAPARAFVKCIKSHSGYSSCEKCVEHGSYVNGRVIFNSCSSDKRTNESFVLQMDEDHHIGISPLLQLNIGLVSDFPIDYMHAVCLGVMKKLLHSWIGGNLNVRLRARNVALLSQNLLALCPFMVREINRRPRSLSELARWKATELRTFLLYLGPLILKNIDIGIYEHFLLLHAGVFILCSTFLTKKCGHDLAHELLLTFVSHSKKIYGAQFLVYNVHILSHLADDSRKYGTLDSFSAFPFENYLGQLKRLLKSSTKPLQQAYCRLVESNNILKIISQTEKVQFFYEHFSGIHLHFDRDYKQYKKISVNGLQMTIHSYSNADCYCLTHTNLVVQISNILVKNSDIFFIGKKFENYSSLYKYPFDSNILNIYVISKLSALQYWSLKQIQAKCLVFPIENTESFVSFPLIHSYNDVI